MCLDPPLAGILLASGLSRRMGTANKLLLPDVHGVAMVRRSAACLLQLYPRIIAVVADPAVTQALQGLDVTVVYNPHPEQGQHYSAYLAVATLCAVPREPHTGALMALADQPYLSVGLLRAMQDYYRARNQAQKQACDHACDQIQDALVPCYQNTSGYSRVGNPRIISAKLLHRWYREGPSFNPRQVLSDSANVHYWRTDDSAVVEDIDTPAAYRHWLQQERKWR